MYREYSIVWINSEYKFKDKFNRIDKVKQE